MKKFHPHRRAVLLGLVAIVAFSCYTVQRPKKVARTTKSMSASKELDSVISEYVIGTLFMYPHVATRLGVHSHELASGETMDLDRELANFSEDVVESRIEVLRGYLDRLDNKAPTERLTANNAADRALLVRAIEDEVDLLDSREAHTNDPLLHVAALAEAVYYPIALEYAPADDRAADVLGRMHWIPSYVDRAIRLLRGGSEASIAAAVSINAQTMQLIEKDLAKMVEGEEALAQSYAGMKPPIIDSLTRLQKFLEEDLPKKDKVTWRLGAERYERRFTRWYPDGPSPDETAKDAERRMDEIREELFAIAKPIYCEANETDREVCGPTKAELEAAARAQEKQRVEEERKKAAEEEKQRKEEERLAKEEERKKAAEEEKQRKEEERLAKEEERKKAAEEKKAKEEEERKKAAEEKKAKPKPSDVDNPYEDKKPPKKDEKKGEGISNPYAMGTWGSRAASVAGAKTAQDEDVVEDAKPAAKEKKPARDEAVSEKTMDKVVGTVLSMIWKAKPESVRMEERLARQLDHAAGLGAAVVQGASASGVEVAQIPAFLFVSNGPIAYCPAPVFEPERKAMIHVAADEKTAPLVDLSRPWMTFAAARWGSPGAHEAFSKTAKIESRPRRVVRTFLRDLAYVEGWSLRAAVLASGSIEDGENSEARMVALAAQLEAAAAAVVDIGLHAKGWDDEKAIGYLEREAYVAPEVALDAVTRMKLFALNGAAPFVGLTLWESAAKAVEKDRGKGFDLRGFHGDALALGPVPASMIAKLAVKDPDQPPADDAFEAPEDQGPKHVTIFGAR